MSLLNIFTFPDEILRQTAQPVTAFDAQLKKLSEDMLETMYDAPGVGLAANQVGVLLRILVLDVDYDIEAEDDSPNALRMYKNKNSRVIVNPEITEKHGKILYKEGCLSVPGQYEQVQRFEKITLQYQDITGKQHTIAADGLLAVALQHEMDHLDGKLFIDRLSPVKKNLIKSKIKKERDKKFERSKFHVEL